MRAKAQPRLKPADLAGARFRPMDIVDTMADLERRVARALRLKDAWLADQLQMEYAERLPAYRAEMARRNAGKPTITLAQLYGDDL